MHAAIAGLSHYRCNGQAYKTSRRAGVLESLNVMVREANSDSGCRDGSVPPLALFNA